MITVADLTKKYNKTNVLDGVSFTIKEGSVVGIIGPNGAGKSTLISIMAGIIKPTEGNVIIDGGKIGYVPQEITLFPHFTVMENLNFWDTMSNHHGKKERQKNIQSITQIAGLQDYLHKKASQLSGGLKRRLNIAVALLSKPDILIMDEPTVGMDISSRSDMVSFIKKLSSHGTTIIYVSHHPDEIERLCHHIICLNQGNLVFDGTQADLKALYPEEDNMHDIILKVSRSIKSTPDKGGSNETHKPDLE